MNHTIRLFLGAVLFFYYGAYGQVTQERSVSDYVYNNFGKIELYKHFELDFDFTPKPTDSMGEKVEKDLPFYFMVIREGNEKRSGSDIKKVAVYNNEGELTNYVLDRAFNLTFSYLQTEYKGLDDHISKTSFYNKKGAMVGYVNYRWIQKKKGNYLLRETDVYGFHPRKKRFVRFENRFFIYNQGRALGKDVNIVTKRTSNLVRFSNENYNSTPFVARYTRFDEKGIVQYRKKIEYDGKEPKKINYYNKDNVLVKTDVF